MEQYVRSQVFHLMRLLSIRMAPLLMSVLMSSVNVVSAQVIEPDRAPLALRPPRHPAVPDFSMQQRAAIYRSVIKSTQKDHRSTLPVGTQIDVGTKLPETAELYPVPEDVRTIAASNKYKYAIWNDQVLIVDPATNTVADILRDYILRDYDNREGSRK